MGEIKCMNIKIKNKYLFLCNRQNKFILQVEGRSYNFLVRAVNDLGDSPDLITEQPVLAKNPFDPPGLIFLSKMFNQF